MPKSATKHISYKDTFGGFFAVNVEFDLTITISEDNSQLFCKITNNTYVAKPGQATAKGFINVAGYLWGDWSFYDDSKPYGYYGGTDKAGKEPWPVVKQSISDIIGKPLDSVAAQYAYCDDKDAKTKGLLFPHLQWTFDLTDKDFDSNGNLKDRIILTKFARFTYANIHVQTDNSTPSFRLSNLDWPYYPGQFAITASGKWFPCTEDKYLHTKSGSSWTDVRNDLYMDSKSRMFVRKSGKWARVPEPHVQPWT